MISWSTQPLPSGSLNDAYVKYAGEFHETAKTVADQARSVSASTSSYAASSGVEGSATIR